MLVIMFFCAFTNVSAQGTYANNNKQIQMQQGETITISIPSNTTVLYQMSYTEEYWNRCYLNVQADYNLQQLKVTALSEGSCYLDLTFYLKSGAIASQERYYVTVGSQHNMEQSIVLAVKTKYPLNFSESLNFVKAEYSSENNAIANVSSQGIIKGVMQGQTTIRAIISGANGEQSTYEYQVIVTNPTLANKDMTLIVGNQCQLHINGIQECSKYEISSSDSSVADVYGDLVYAIKEGKATLTVLCDGKKMTCVVNVVKPDSTLQLIALEKGKKKRINLNYVNQNSVVTYQSLNKKIATVSKTGNVKAINSGTTTIQVNIDQNVIYIPVVVNNKNVVSAINFGLQSLGASYSQAKRMQEGYFDCSSFIWRAYHTTGINFGNDTWAPTAAAIAQYCENNNKVISYEAISVNELKPGDLLFFAKGDNGRFMNIYHVAMYAGTKEKIYKSMDGLSTETITEGLLLEARNNGVGLFAYGQLDRNVVMVARPTKK